MEATAIKMFIDTIKYEDGDLIWVKPVCDFFGMDAKYQYQRIKSDPILGVLVEKNLPDLGKIDQGGRIFLTRKGFVRWIQTVTATTVDEKIKDKFIEYQSLIFDFLYGSAELHSTIRKVRSELDRMKQSYSETGRLIQQREKELKELLDNVYQYRLPFTEQKQLQ